MKLTAIIVDDKVGPRNALADDLRKRDDVAQVLCFASYEQATLPILDTKPDVLFLDVEMPGKSGIDFLDSVQPYLQHRLRVVFYTAYDAYMKDAIHHSAFDYLLKPYLPEELDEVMTRIAKDINNVGPATSTGASLATCNSNSKIAIQTASKLLLVHPEDLLLVQYNKDQRVWQLMLTDRSEHRLRVSMKADDLLNLDSNLLRISQNCIVNMRHLSSIENTSFKCSFNAPYDDIVVDVSRTYYNKIKEKFNIL